jgi:peptidyl-prolyl cis-trans isomerase SurA
LGGISSSCWTKKGLPSLNEKRPEIERKISRDSRSAKKKSTALKELKARHNFEIAQANKQKAFAVIDSTLLMAKWQVGDSNDKLAKQTLFKINNSETSVAEFWEYVVANQKRRKSTPLGEYIDFLYGRFQESQIFEYEKQQIAENNREYQMILDEYKSGILLFNLMEEKVWNRAVQDTAGLKAFYTQNLKKYPAPEKLVARKLVVSDSLLLDSLRASLSLSNSQLDSLFNADEALTLQITNEEVEKNQNEFLDSHWQVGNHIESGEDYFILWAINEIKPKGTKELNEVKGLVISDYQAQLEKQWLADLRSKYPVKINKANLKKYVKSIQ